MAFFDAMKKKTAMQNKTFAIRNGMMQGMNDALSEFGLSFIFP